MIKNICQNFNQKKQKFIYNDYFNAKNIKIKNKNTQIKWLFVLLKIKKALIISKIIN